jgi:glutamate/tyrosine decarboxylase-like PLP-dependent enzyme
VGQRLDELRAACAAPLPHPDEAEMRARAGLVLDWLLRHHATLPDQPIGRPATGAEMAALLAEPPPEEGRDFAAVLDEFATKVAPHACRINHPRFLAFIPAAPTWFSVLGDLLCTGTNFFAGVWLEAAGPAQVELVVLDWFRRFLDMPATTQGVLTSGGSEATLVALAVARSRLTEAERGRAVLYVSEQRHWSVDRSAMVLGLRADQVRPVPADDELRLRPAALAAAVGRDRADGRVPWAVVVNAGTTNTGAVDPLADAADVCAANGLWLHVDAAYGWTAALTDEGRALFGGLDRADSVTLDPHKWLAQAYDVGCVLVRDGPLLARTFSMRPEYMQDVAPAEGEVNFCDLGPALTRRFRALKVWLSLKVLGVGWFRALVERCFRLTDLAEALLRREGVFEVLSPRRLSVVCFRHVPAGFRPAGEDDERRLDEHNLRLIDAVRATGRAFLASTRLRGRVAIRFCFVNWRTTAADVEEVVRLLRTLGDDLARDATPSEPEA